MSCLVLIAGVARNGAIGQGGRLLWRLPADLQHFRRTTLGHPVVMGRKTWDSLPSAFKPLPGRRNVVVTRNDRWQADGAERAGSLDGALECLAAAPKVFVIGGGELYRQALPRADELVLTEVDADFEDADVFFPAWERAAFDEVARETHAGDAPWRFDFVTYRRKRRMKIATWNVNSLAIRLPQLLDWLAANPVEAIVLQETKLVDDKFPRAEIEAAGYRVHCFGQKTYNGVALLSRSEASDVQRNIFGFADAQARVISATVAAGVRVVGAYFPNGQSPGSEKFEYKLSWMRALRDWLRDELDRHPRLVLLGDFNVAPEDRDVHDPLAWAGQIHCTDEEREQFRQLLRLGLVDAFRLFEQPEKCWSWWDYRMLAFRRNQGLRIDHILVSEALRPQIVGCTIDKLPRKNERPSDHAPVVVELRTPEPAAAQSSSPSS